MSATKAVLEANRALIRYQAQGLAKEAEIRRASGVLAEVASSWTTIDEQVRANAKMLGFSFAD
jgi:hypothetical protein